MRPRRGHLRAVLAHAGFARLYAVRLFGQFGDGVFQASLAGAVLFNPQHQAGAAAVASAFTVVLLPYSLLGPFAGVLLDRWWRRHVLVYSNLIRSVAVALVAAEIFGGVSGGWFYASALVVVGISRFFLAALSAALPHVVAPIDLVTANAFCTTSGAIATTVGGAAAIGVRLAVGSSDAAYAAIALAAIVPYLAAAGAGRGFGTASLGPDDVARQNRETAQEIVRGLVAGARHVAAIRPVFCALAAITMHRLCFGLWTVWTLLLYRNYFHGQTVLKAGIGGLGQLVTAVAIGGGLAALVTPIATRRLGYVRWPALTLALSAAVQLASVLPYRLWTVVLGGCVLGLLSQGLKITVDTLVQENVEDEFRGRVFALYDTLFNIALVVAAALTVAFLPEDGHAPGAVFAVGALYLLTAGLYLVGVSASARRTSAAAR